MKAPTHHFLQLNPLYSCVKSMLDTPGIRNLARSPVHPNQSSNSGKFTKALSLPGHKVHPEHLPGDENDVVVAQANSGTTSTTGFGVGGCITTGGGGGGVDSSANEQDSRGESAAAYEPVALCSEFSRETQSTFNSVSTNPVDPQMSRSSSTASLYGVGADKFDRLQAGHQQLVLLLQVTHELEVEHFNSRRLVAEKELTMVRAECKRLHRKRYNILGSVRLVHSDDFDDLEHRMLKAKLLMEQLQEEIREFTARWTRIEALTGQCLRQNPGLDKLYSALAQLTNGTGVPRLPTGSRTQPVGGLHLQPPKSSVQWACTDSEASTRVGSLGRSESSLLSPAPVSSASAAALVAYPVELDEPVGGITAKYSGAPHQRHHSHALSSKSGLPRNYSFVRPFATLWRKKATNPANKKNQ